MSVILEDSRKQIISTAKLAKKETEDNLTRFDKRTKVKVLNTVSAMNNLDMNKFFKRDILEVVLTVRGETSDYEVIVGLVDILKNLRSALGNNQVSLKAIQQAISKSFNDNDIYSRCNCPDYVYRFAYWNSRHDTIVGNKETRPAVVTNPKDNLGPSCKHTLAVLANQNWVASLASTIYNYIRYMENNRQKQYADYIYPVVYGKEYEDPVQLTLDDTDELETSKDKIKDINTQTKKSTQFQKGNTQGVRFTSNKNNEDEQTLLI